MRNAEGLSLDEIRRLLESSRRLTFQGLQRAEMYKWVEETLRQQNYLQQPKAERGLLLAYLAKVTGLSFSQMDRLVSQFRHSGQVREVPYTRHRFSTIYTPADIVVLAAANEAPQHLSGPATQRILQREWELFGKPEYQRLSQISVPPIYNLRKTVTYRRHSSYFQKTKPSPVAIGERRRPDPQGRPGYLRVDTVHQGDRDGEKGVYHINAVDAVTQWEVLGCTPKISEWYLKPVLAVRLREIISMA